MDLLPGIDSTFWKVGRLQTFEHWPFQSSDNSCNPERMATAGFVAIGNKEEPDLVECFICSKQLDGWDPEDDPWIEHSKHQSQCPYIGLGKPDEASWTVHDLFDLFKKYTVKECTQELELAKIKVKEESAKAAKEIPQIYKALRKSYRDPRLSVDVFLLGCRVQCLEFFWPSEKMKRKSENLDKNDKSYQPWTIVLCKTEFKRIR